MVLVCQLLYAIWVTTNIVTLNDDDMVFDGLCTKLACSFTSEEFAGASVSPHCFIYYSSVVTQFDEYWDQLFSTTGNQKLKLSGSLQHQRSCYLADPHSRIINTCVWLSVNEGLQLSYKQVLFDTISNAEVRITVARKWPEHTWQMLTADISLAVKDKIPVWPQWLRCSAFVSLSMQELQLQWFSKKCNLWWM